MANETTLRRYLAKLLKPHAVVSQIESGATAAGIPDTVAFLHDTKSDVWIELKNANHFLRSFELRKTQIGWMQRRVRAGGHCFVLLRHTDPKKTRTHHLIRVDSMEVIRFLATNQSVMWWSAAAAKEWGHKIDIDELLEELTK